MRDLILKVCYVILLKVGKIDHFDESQEMGIKAIPTILFVCNKREVTDRVIGNVSELQHRVDELIQRCQREMIVKNSKIQNAKLQNITSMPELNGRAGNINPEIFEIWLGSQVWRFKPK